MSQLLTLTNAIEQIRIQSNTPSDKLNLAQTMTYLESIAKNSKYANIFITLAERYAYNVLYIPPIDTFQAKILFSPQIKSNSMVSEDELADLANVFLAKRLFKVKDYLAAESRLMEVSQRSNQMDEVCKLLTSVSLLSKVLLNLKLFKNLITFKKSKKTTNFIIFGAEWQNFNF